MIRPIFNASRRRRRSHITRAECVTRWVLRGLQHRDHWQAYVGRDCNPTVLLAAGIEHNGARGPSRAWLKAKVAERAGELAECGTDLGPYGDGIEVVGRALGLDGLDRKIVAFIFYHCIDSGLNALVSDLQETSAASGHGLVELLAVVMGIEASALHTALRHDGTLYTTGALDPDDMFGIDGFELPCLTGAIITTIRARPASEQEVLSRFIGVSETSRLWLGDFEHLGQPMELAARYLQRAVKTGMRGVNLLLHGPPGTGKTELAKVLAEYADAVVYTVRDGDSDGDEADRNDRLHSYRLAQRLLGSRRGAVILFDEVEDVFGWSGPGGLMPARRRGSKAWLNRLLEDNSAPAIWITNDADSMDPALLRRFDLAVHLDKLARGARSRVAHSILRGLPISDRTVATIAADERVAPADIERAARVAKVAHGRRHGPLDAPLLEVLETNLAVRHGASPRSYPHDERRFELDLIDADMDLGELVGGLCRTGRGRICLYGPPGTGKTAFAHHVGQRMGLPVLHKRASDLLDMYVGGTEGKIAEMFDEADRQNAVLLLDEADSFLRDRRSARHAWEVTQVNELLVQMEAFDGVLICATNLDSALDLASARRFDCHVRFGALTEQARWRLFVRTVAEAGQSTRSRAFRSLRAQVDSTGGVVLGDFNVARRRSALLGRTLDGPTLLAWLRQAQAARDERGGRPLGFNAAVVG